MVMIRAVTTVNASEEVVVRGAKDAMMRREEGSGWERKYTWEGTGRGAGDL